MTGHFQDQEGLPPERWVTLERRLIYEQLPWLRLYADDVRLPDGREVDGYLQIETPGYAMIVPLDEKGRIGLVRSYKRGLDDVDVQPPAGMIDGDEPPQKTARRELLEEMGCEAENWHPLGSYVMSGNYGAGWAHIFLATGCNQVQEPNAGDLERQKVLWIPIAEVQAAWRSGGFRQIGAAAGIGLALDRIAQLKGEA